MPLSKDQLLTLHRELDLCKRCPKMIGPVVHGSAIVSKVILIGQAPGPREGSFGHPFAWTAGKTLFQWFHTAMCLDESDFRARIYIAAVARCFPGKAKGGGDRKPDPEEISKCRTFLEREIAILQPELIIPVGTLAIEQVLARKALLKDTVGQQLRINYLAVEADVIALPHPSGLSSWHKTEPGRSLLTQALALIAAHPAMLSKIDANTL